jgi:hypothetical protein
VEPTNDIVYDEAWTKTNEESEDETMLLDMNETGVCVEKVGVETDACGKYICK